MEIFFLFVYLWNENLNGDLELFKQNSGALLEHKNDCIKL